MLDPALLTKPATDSWPTYNGDYSGRRFSTLTQINQKNVKQLSLGWIFRVKVGLHRERLSVELDRCRKVRRLIREFLRLRPRR